MDGRFTKTYPATVSHQERQTQLRRRVRIIETINVQSVEASMDGANNLRTRAVRVRKRVPRASILQIAVTSNVKETQTTNAQLDPKQAATVSPVARKGKTE